MDVEKECNLLGTLFQSIVTDLKSSSPAWEDFVNKGTKLHSLLKSTTIAMSSFLEAIQRIADVATNTKGSTKDIGSALTRICVRQKMMENKLKFFTNSMLDNLILPIQERLEEWKKVANQLEKDHAKDYKKAMHEIKKRNTDSIRLQKKARKGSKSDLHQQLNSMMHDVNDRFACLEETEKSALRNLLVEERSRICLFANSLTPVLDLEVSMLNEVSHLSELTNDVARLCRNPKQLPTSTEQLVQDFINKNSNQTSQFSPTLQDVMTQNIPNGGGQNGISPPSSPVSTGSRKSSLCSLNSSDSRSSGSLNHNASSFHHHRYQSYHRRTPSGGMIAQGSPTSCKSAPSGGNATVARLSSVSSHDSGFISAGNGNTGPLMTPGGEMVSPVMTKPPLPNTSHDKAYSSESTISSENVSPIIRSRPASMPVPEALLSPGGQNKSGFWKDWSKPGPYDAIDNNFAVNNADQQRRSQLLPSKHFASKPNTLPQRVYPNDGGSYPSRPPLHHTISEPAFFGSNYPRDSPVVPPKPEKFAKTPELPPFPTSCGDSQPPMSVDDLPPPPPSLLAPNETTPTYEPQPPVAPNEVNITQPLYATPNPVMQADFGSMTLGRKSSSHSLQYSSGYSSQNTTPACSEDTIASHDTDYGSVDGEEHHHSQQQRYDAEAWTTLPRSRDYKNATQTLGGRRQRPASTSGFPASSNISEPYVPGTATIRRKPSSKFNSVRRSSNVPKPVKPPTVPSNTIASLMSTFQAPADHNATNINNNNNATSVDLVNGYGQNLPDAPPFSTSGAGLSLKLKQNGDFRDGASPGLGSPTPSVTPTPGEAFPPCNGFRDAPGAFPRGNDVGE